MLHGGAGVPPMRSVPLRATPLLRRPTSPLPAGGSPGTPPKQQHLRPHQPSLRLQAQLQLPPPAVVVAPLAARHPRGQTTAAAAHPRFESSPTTQRTGAAEPSETADVLADGRGSSLSGLSTPMMTSPIEGEVGSWNTAQEVLEHLTD